MTVHRQNITVDNMGKWTKLFRIKYRKPHGLFNEVTIYLRV